MTDEERKNLIAGSDVAREIYGATYLMGAEDNGLYDLFWKPTELTHAQEEKLILHGWKKHGWRWQLTTR